VSVAAWSFSCCSECTRREKKMTAVPPEQQDSDPSDPVETPPEPDEEADVDGYGGGPDEDGGAPDEGANPPLPAG
jgi:hypothetical protein